MVEKRQHEQVTSGIPPVSVVYNYAKQLERELQDAMNGTTEDRDALFSTSALQLAYLHRFLNVFAHQCKKPEVLAHRCRQDYDYWVETPHPTNRPSLLAVQLARVLKPYLNSTSHNRGLLSRVCGSIFFDMYTLIDVLTKPNCDERETLVYFRMELAPFHEEAPPPPLDNGRVTVAEADAIFLGFLVLDEPSPR